MKTLTLLKYSIISAAFLSVSGVAQDSKTPTTAPLEVQGEKKGYWHDIVYGNTDAPVEIIEYASLTCTHCSRFTVEVFPLLKEKYIDTNKVKLRFRNFFLNSFDYALSVVSRCKDEDLARKLTHSFLEQQENWMNAKEKGSEAIIVLESIATLEGLPEGDFKTCLENKALAEHLLKKRMEWVEEDHIAHTPTIMLDGVEVAPPTWVKLEAAIEEKLNALK